MDVMLKIFITLAASAFFIIACLFRLMTAWKKTKFNAREFDFKKHKEGEASRYGSKK